MVKNVWFLDCDVNNPLSAFEEIAFSCDPANKATRISGSD